MELNGTRRLIEEKVSGGSLGSYFIEVYYRGEAVTLRSEDVNEDTVFDMASLGKVFPTATLAIRAIDDGVLSLSDRLDKFFPEAPKDKAGITVKNLLTHTSGMLRASYPDGVAARGRDSIIEFLFSRPLSDPTGERYAYCCDGFLLLGFILERVYGKSLDVLLEERIARPLGLTRTGYGTANGMENSVTCLTRLVPGESLIDDCNLRRIGDIPAGNGGNHTSPHDLRSFVRALMEKDGRLYSEEAFRLAEQNYTAGLPVLDEHRGLDNRGLGFVHVNERCYQACELFPDGSIGHEGYTGQSFFLNRDAELYVIILSDATRCTVKKYGRANYDEVCDLRAEIHRAVKADLSL